jgi:hypothetical protein
MKKRIIMRDISKLKPNRRQSVLFRDLSESELEALAADLKKNGLVSPIEILPDGTIICGHQRVLAAKRLSWTEIRCWVRDDLAKAGDEAVERRLIEDNFNRRQLGRLEIGRCYKRLRDLERGNGRRTWNGQGELCNFLAKRFDLSGRTLDRYAKILDAPLEIQRAFEADKLPLVLAARFPGLPEGIQRKIVATIKAGQNPKKLFEDYAKAEDPSRAADSVSGHLTRTIEHDVKVLQGLFNATRYGTQERCLRDLRNGQNLIAGALRQIEHKRGTK